MKSKYIYYIFYILLFHTSAMSGQRTKRTKIIISTTVDIIKRKEQRIYETNDTDWNGISE